MRLLPVLFFVFLTVPALAADQTPWTMAQKNEPAEGFRRWYCCRHCRADEYPCMGQCIKLAKGENGRIKCAAPTGCACAYGEGSP
jgi:hypothetical protein